MKINGEHFGGLVRPVGYIDKTNPNFGKCTECGGELDYRDLYRNNLCVKCRRKQDKNTRLEFLAKAKELSVDERIARLEALFYDHETDHVSKVLHW